VLAYDVEENAETVPVEDPPASFQTTLRKASAILFSVILTSANSNRKKQYFCIYPEC